MRHAGGDGGGELGRLGHCSARRQQCGCEGASAGRGDGQSGRLGRLPDASPGIVGGVEGVVDRRARQANYACGLPLSTGSTNRAAGPSLLRAIANDRHMHSESV